MVNGKEKGWDDWVGEWVKEEPPLIDGSMQDRHAKELGGSQ